MITITNTSNLVEVAWIVMGIWAAVTLTNEFLNIAKELYDGNNYWKRRFEKISEVNDQLHNEIEKLKDENGHND